MEGTMTEEKDGKKKGEKMEEDIVQLSHPPRHPKLQPEFAQPISCGLNPSLLRSSLINLQVRDHSFASRRRSDVQPVSISINKPLPNTFKQSEPTVPASNGDPQSFKSSPSGSSFQGQTMSPITASHESRQISKSNVDFKMSDDIIKFAKENPIAGDSVSLRRLKRNSDASFLPTTAAAAMSTTFAKSSSGQKLSYFKESCQTRNSALTKHIRTPESQAIPTIPPPPDPRWKPHLLTHRRSVDLLDFPSKESRSLSLTRPLSSLSQTTPCNVDSSIASQVPEHEPALIKDALINRSPSPSSSHLGTSDTLSSLSLTEELQSNSALNVCSGSPQFSSTKVLQARMSLSGLSPPLSRSSEELGIKSCASYTPLLSTPDLKIELLDADERRLSIADQFSPPYLRHGFPGITPDDLTPEEIHEFDMKWGSPHHSRGFRGLARPTLLTLPPTRPRMTSLPNREDDNDGDEEDHYRLRHFSITGRGVVNRGDSFRSRRTKSNTSMASDVSSNDGWAWSHPCSLHTSAASSAASSRASSASECIFPYRVIMLGGAGVGKTTLCHQFMTSEHINAYGSSLDDEYGEKSVSVLLDGEESEIQFIDHPAEEMSVENCLATYNPHAILVVFSVIDRQSYVRAEEILQYLWRLDVMSNKGVILVGNKTDLVRNRCVPPKECSNLADSYDCKFIETSSGLNHQVDELLVGVLKQIRLKVHNPEVSREVFRKRSTRRKKYRGTKTSASLKVKSILTKVCGKEIKSKSCENLHVL